MSKKIDLKLEDESTTYFVDIPNSQSEEWICVKVFGTEAEAIAYARKRFGADEKGMVSLISKS